MQLFWYEQNSTLFILIQWNKSSRKFRLKYTVSLNITTADGAFHPIWLASWEVINQEVFYCMASLYFRDQIVSKHGQSVEKPQAQRNEYFVALLCHVVRKVILHERIN